WGVSQLTCWSNALFCGVLCGVFVRCYRRNCELNCLSYGTALLYLSHLRAPVSPDCSALGRYARADATECLREWVNYERREPRYGGVRDRHRPRVPHAHGRVLARVAVFCLWRRGA